MSERDNSGPAFPACNAANVNDAMGMTLRDYFAGQALLSMPSVQGTRDVAWMQQNGARYAYAVADAMLAARKAEDDA